MIALKKHAVSEGVRLAAGAHYPWLDVDSVTEIWINAGLPVFTSRAAKCLFCEKPECVNCISGGTGRKRGRPRKNAAEAAKRTETEGQFQ